MPRMMRSLLATMLLLAAVGIVGPPIANMAANAAEPGNDGASQAGLKIAIFAGGCFWCEEAVFDAVPGVVSVISGYTDGDKANPTYEEVSAGGTGHAESVKVTFDPAKVSYAKLLDLFWHNVDPLTENAQFCDHGTQYRSAIFYLDEEQKRLAEASKQALAKSGRFDQPIVTEISPASTFWPAEDYHQKYHVKNPVKYQLYRFGCGRDQRLRELWGPPAHAS
jgi:peptide-methionine (S)-S-oxide reductase